METNFNQQQNGSQQPAGLHKYLMNWNEQSNAWEVVYARTFDEAEEKYSNGEFELDEE